MREIPNYKMKAFGFDDLFGKDVKDGFMIQMVFRQAAGD